MIIVGAMKFKKKENILQQKVATWIPRKPRPTS